MHRCSPTFMLALVLLGWSPAALAQRDAPIEDGVVDAGGEPATEAGSGSGSGIEPEAATDIEPEAATDIEPEAATPVEPEVATPAEREPAAVDAEPDTVVVAAGPEPAVAPSVPATETDRAAQRTSSGWSIDVKGKPLSINPFVAVVGGGYYQLIQNTPAEDMPDGRQDRATTVALSRLGLRADWAGVFELESELELNAGPFGTSVWEGQAALQVRNQLMRINYKGLSVEAGRITDPTSLDFFSMHAVGNMLLTDDFARFPLLVSGFNRGNGVMARYEVIKGLRLGITANAGNPTSTTGTVMIGGTFPPFQRFYEVPWSAVGRDARGFPTTSFHAYLLSPSVRYDHDYVRAQFSGQWFSVNTNTNIRDDDAITGYNLRGGVQGRLWKDRIHPFVNAARILNDIVEPEDTSVRSAERYRALSGSTGVDVDITERFGAGVQYSLIHEQQGSDGTEFVTHTGNMGAGFLVLPFVSLDARYGTRHRCDGLSGGCDLDREHRFYLTLRAAVGALRGAAGRP